MFCKNCGNNMGNNFVCPYCGMNNAQPQMIPEPPQKGENKIIIIIIVLLFALAVGVFVVISMKKEQVEEEKRNPTSNIEESNTNTNTNSTSNIESNTNSNSIINTNTNGNTSPEHLVCKQTLNDVYGTYETTLEYDFKNGQLSSYKGTIVTTLSQSYLSYKDSLLKQYDDLYAAYKGITGINFSSQNKDDGFIYIVEIPSTSDVDTEKLTALGLSLTNYSAVKMDAYKNGLTCE